MLLLTLCLIALLTSDQILHFAMTFVIKAKSRETNYQSIAETIKQLSFLLLHLTPTIIIH
jgi:hypothetical protein